MVWFELYARRNIILIGDHLPNDISKCNAVVILEHILAATAMNGFLQIISLLHSG